VSDTPRFGEIAAKLRDNGYLPLPLHYGQKRPCPDAWTTYELSDDDLRRYAKSGTGILCGKVIGADIDVRVAALVGKLEDLAEQMLGAAPRRVGLEPKVLRMYQADAPFTKRTTRGYRLPGDGPEDKLHKVEILAQGQQFVAYNQHPDSGQPYTWNGAGDPLTVPIGLLPVVTEAMADAYIAAAEQLLAQCGRPVTSFIKEDGDRAHEPNEQRAADPALLRQALAALPNERLDYDDWIYIGLAVRGALGETGFDAFDAWSQKHAQYDAKNTTEAWKSFKPNRLGAGTIYHLAAQHGWERPRSGPEPEPPWPEPANIFTELTAAPFEAADLPPELAAYPQLYAEQTGIDASITLTAATGCAAAAIADQIQVCADSSTAWFAQPRLWLLAIAAPGAGKSPGQREMLAPLWELHAELDEEWRQEVDGLGKDEHKPDRTRVIVGDTTLEALSTVLVENPRGVLLATDEFDAWLGSLDQYRSGSVGRDRAEWLRLFDGGPHQIERVNRGTVYVPNWGASILTATTPAAMRRLTRHLPEDGLLQRFIVVLAGRQRITTQQRPQRAEIRAERERYAQTLRRLWSMKPRMHNGVVPISPEAHDRFTAWRGENMELQEAMGSLDSALEAHVAKYPTLALRLALVFHCAQIVNVREEGARDPAATAISVDTLEVALRFLRRASRHALAMYLGRKGGSEVYEVARDVARWIVSRSPDDNAKGLQRRDLLQRVGGYKSAEENVQAAALRLLADLGWVRVREGSGYNKAQPTRYTVSPHLHTRFAAIAEAERRHRAIARERIQEAAAERRGGAA